MIAAIASGRDSLVVISSVKKSPNVFHYGTDIIGMSQKLETLTENISSENLKLDQDTKAEISKLKEFVEKVTEHVPKNKYFSGFSAYSADEVVAANKMRAIIKRLESLSK